MDQLIEQFFNIEIMIAAWPTILRGLWMTLAICAVVIPMGLLGGLFAALGMLSQNRALRWATVGFVDFSRAIPPLVLLIFVYSGLPFAGLRLSPFAAVAIAFLLNNSAYYGEIFRAGIGSVGTGQTEAARSTGLGASQTMAYVVLPQAVRNVLPDLISNTIEVVKLTSLASVVSLAEMLYAADMARSVTYSASPLVLAAGIYLVILWPLVRLVSRFERRIAH
ncbi:amino acid ABC transporter permease [Roseovarius sp.]|uniref:amino acid ABC transporter permease n=1 Tax=Roseovarius sp. TaxID=1486281 RepID=UPI000C4858EE|nr:amino acid ABC transporter permease [Roseovarius sp.]MAZ22967.1 polar amino acid ABC transporter permease [Roseovarius sp.]